MLAIGGFWITGCQAPKEKIVAPPPDPVAPAIDTTVSPGDNFFKYAEGNWIKNTPVPPQESSWGIGLDVQNEVYDRLRKICEDDAANPTDKKSETIGALWATGMDSIAIEEEGIKTLQPYLDKINALQSPSEYTTMIADMQIMGVNSALGFYVGQDDKNSNVYALNFYQSGIGLPNRDYYFNTDARTTNIRNEYVRHIAKMFELLGRDSVTAGKTAKDVMAFETALAKASRKREDLRDPYKNYNKIAVADLGKKFSNIGWDQFFTSIQIRPDSVIVGQPEFITAVSNMVKATPIETWKDYFTWQLVNAYANSLPNAFVTENFHFYGTVLSGRKEMRPRWKRILNAEEGYVGDLLGQEFVKNYFPPSARQRYVNIVNAMTEAYKEHIENLDWMTDSTKHKALVKLAAIRKKIGYPDKWKDYSNLTFTRKSYLQNVIAGERWQSAYNLHKFGTPVDRDEWGMTPQTYNAYYNPSNNEIVLPAAIFTIPGIPDSLVDDAVVYGYAAASTIGHEMTHGFDDEGSQYDAKGNLHDWWTKKDRDEFNKRVQGIIKQFNGYVVLDSLHVNGKATAGENIADLGGVAIGLTAFKKTEEYKKGEKIAGLTPLQRYFLGYALGWRVGERDERLAMQVMSDVHSPAYLRVNGPFSDIPEFYEAFNVKPGQAMYRPDSERVKIW